MQRSIFNEALCTKFALAEDSDIFDATVILN